MTRVLHLLNYAGQGGTEQYIRTLLQAMEGQEVQAELACNEAGPLAQWAEARGLPVHSLAMASPFDRGAVKALAALCRAGRVTPEAAEAASIDRETFRRLAGR